MKRVGGNRRKSRYKMKKSVSEKGKLHISRFMQKFEEGDKVLLKAYPSYQKGLFCLRFHGKVGEIKSKQGECYNVSIMDGNKAKVCVVHPVHMLRA
ncbi:MAG: 50S ribosomal protein L21e [Nanoarchaeota archaeon]|nr:50S ribosomal protein L21e [Nanoarchaeota archaeon]